MLILNFGVSVTITIGVVVSGIFVGIVSVGKVGVINGARTGDGEIGIVVSVLSTSPDGLLILELKTRPNIAPPKPRMISISNNAGWYLCSRRYEKRLGSA